MQITYHLIVSEAALASLIDWEQWCQSEGIPIEIRGADQIPTVSQSLLLSFFYHGVQANVQIYREWISDVKDFCDDLTQHLAEDHALSLNFYCEGDTHAVHLLTIALAIAVYKSKGLCYIEGDGRFIKPETALVEAKSIQAALPSAP